MKMARGGGRRLAIRRPLNKRKKKEDKEKGGIWKEKRKERWNTQQRSLSRLEQLPHGKHLLSAVFNRLYIVIVSGKGEFQGFRKIF